MFTDYDNEVDFLDSSCPTHFHFFPLGVGSFADKVVTLVKIFPRNYPTKGLRLRASLRFATSADTRSRLMNFKA